MEVHICILYLSQSAAGNQAYTHHGPLMMYFFEIFFKKKIFLPAGELLSPFIVK